MKQVLGRTVFAVLSIGLALCNALPLAAGEEPAAFALRAVPHLPVAPGEIPEVALGSAYTVKVRLSSEVAGLEAWSLGLCIDTKKQAILAAGPGEDLSRIFFGNPPEYSVIRIWTEAEAQSGVTQAVVLDTRGGSRIGVIPSSAAVSVLRVDLEPTQAASGGDATASFCDAVGTPPVETLFVIGNTAVAPGIQEGSVVSVVRDPPTLIAFSEDEYSLALSVGSFQATARVRSTLNLYGFSFGVSHDPALLRLDGPVAISQDLVAALGGQEPEFFLANVVPDAGFTVGAVFQTSAPPSGSDLRHLRSDKDRPSTSVVTAAYGPGPEAQEGLTTKLTVTGGLGTPPVAVIFDLGEEHVPNKRGAAVRITQEPEVTPFRRGDINADGLHVVSDAVLLLRVLFSGYQLSYDCASASDVNDDGRTNLGDAVYLLSYLFISGPPPPAPFPACGSLPLDHPTFIGCKSYPGCGA